MTAEEIRSLKGIYIAQRREETPEPGSDEIPVVVMIEIAAQFAELNATLKRIFHAEDEDVITRNFGPRLTVNKLD